MAILTPMAPDDSIGVLERLRRTVEQFPFPQVGRVTVSIGATRIDSEDDGSSAFGRADEALYFAKQNGRNRAAIYESLVDAGDLEMKIREAEEAEFF